MNGIPPLFADECVRREIVEFLISMGVDVVSIVDIAPSAVDPEVLRQSELRQRVLITSDFDFGELLVRDRQSALGVILVALARLRTSLHGPNVHAALLAHRTELVGKFLMIEPGRTRIRELASGGA